MNKSKRIIASALCCLCLMGSTQTAFAAMPAYSPLERTVGVQPYWTTLTKIALSMSYAGSTLSWGGSISGESTVSSISATYTLERLAGGSYTFVDSWSFSGTRSYLDSSSSISTAKGTYRLTVSVSTRTSAGTTENASNTLTKTFS